VGYPILRLQEAEQDVQRYVWRLEEILIRTVADFGVVAQRVPGLRGIWVEEQARLAKIGAIGVRIARWTTMHGFALNVQPNLAHFDLIVPCGIRDKGVTSLQRLCGRAFTPTEVLDRLVVHVADILERTVYEAEASALPAVLPGQIITDGPEIRT
jgi:lipoyl(octanoyl) transferase